MSAGDSLLLLTPAKMRVVPGESMEASVERSSGGIGTPGESGP